MMRRSLSAGELWRDIRDFIEDPIRICVYGSSSATTNAKYIEAARELGKLIAEKKYLCVNGAGRSGVMGGLNDACLEAGGQVRGVIHQKFVVDAGEHSKIQDMVVSHGEDLGERKNLLMDNADCLIALPGGVGTFDEIWDAASHKSLGMKDLHGKPICLVSIDGYYDGFEMQINRAYADGVLYHPAEKYFHVAHSVAEALEWSVKTFEEERAYSRSSEGQAQRKEHDQRMTVRTEKEKEVKAEVFTVEKSVTSYFHIMVATAAYLLLGDALFHNK